LQLIRNPKHLLPLVIKETEGMMTLDLSPKAIELIKKQDTEGIFAFYQLDLDILMKKLLEGTEMTEKEIEFLISEGNKPELALLQATDLPASHPVIKGITNRLINKD
jgi:hypothetical protein